MCLSPHEMTSKRIEHLVESYTRYADESEQNGDHADAKRLRKKAGAFADILKERAEDGSYDGDVDPRTGEKRI